MTELERAALHRDLWSELRNQPVKKAATPWWYRLSYAAAGLFVVVGLVAVVSQLGGTGEETAETFADATSGLDESLQPLGEGGQEDSASTTIAAADAIPESTPDFETLATEARRQELPAAVRATASTPENRDCVNAAGLENQEVVGTVEGDRTYLIAVANDEDLDADTAVNFVDATTCEVAHVEE
jgi:pyruvate/2-oxoglutarate dehydrogenase complex dihydrolipoamide acyltransferase (E2) component